MAWFALRPSQNAGETDHNGQKYLKGSIFITLPIPPSGPWS